MMNVNGPGKRPEPPFLQKIKHTKEVCNARNTIARSGND